MKKFLLLFAAFALTLSLAACNGGEELPELPETVDMTNIDEYLDRPDVQYVDLRNFDDKIKSGYIEGFTFVPFFDVLEATDILVRTSATDWNFADANVKSQAGLESFFDADKAIFLMCGSGTRAGYVKDALESLGYENVYNVGGIADYAGDNKVDGDGSYNVEVQLPLPSVVDMTNIDMYLGRTDVQYVDLRDFDDKIKSGYIEGFTFVPFFDVLEETNILVRTDGDWTYAAEDTVSQAALESFFDADKAIFLMCGSGTRAGYVKDALEAAGYTNVYNVGGIGTYTGDNKVDGDGSYRVAVETPGAYTPGTYYGYDPVGNYIAIVTINENGGIGNVFFDALNAGTTEQALGYGYNMKLFSGGTYEWFEMANMLADYITMNQGWDGIELDETAIDPTWNANTVAHHFLYLDTETTTDAEVVPDAIAAVTIGVEGFVLAWNDAIAQATEAGTEGLVSTTGTAQEWADAHAGLTDGTYISIDQATGYFAKIVVEGGVLVDVFFDAAYSNYVACIVSGTTTEDTTVAKADCDETAGDVQVYDETTKQILGEDYMLASSVTWAAEADELAAAILEAGEWDAAWVITPGATDADHDKFDMTDTDTADAVGGVTIGIEGFKAAFDDCMDQASGGH